MARPRSAGDVNAAARASTPPDEPLPSPTKGILMTPGTAAARRKTVTFGDHVKDKDEAPRATKSGLPDDCPGKFPSPWKKEGIEEPDPEDKLESARPKTKLAEQFEQIRDESAKKRRARRPSFDDTGEDDYIPKQFADPTTSCGKYWKAQYDSYRENTQREVKKLIAKQRAAKGFAKDKDFQCTQLADDLKQEKKKVDRLSRKTAELEAQLEDMRRLLQGSKGSEVATESITPQSRPTFRERLDSGKGLQEAMEAAGTLRSLTIEERARSILGPDVRKSAATQQVPSDVPESAGPTKLAQRQRPETTRARPADDMWTPLVTPGLERKQPGNVKTAAPSQSPLKALSVNTLPPPALQRRDSGQPSPPLERKSKAPGVTTSTTESKPHASRILTPPAVHLSARPSTAAPSRRAETSPVRNTMATQEAQKPAETIPRAIVEQQPNENTTAAEVKVKPSMAWNAINAPSAGKRATSLVDKSGKEVGLDRVEAAKARIAARRRVMS